MKTLNRTHIRKSFALVSFAYVTALFTVLALLLLLKAILG